MSTPDLLKFVHHQAKVRGRNSDEKPSAKLRTRSIKSDDEFYLVNLPINESQITPKMKKTMKGRSDKTNKQNDPNACLLSRKHSVSTPIISNYTPRHARPQIRISEDRSRRVANSRSRSRSAKPSQKENYEETYDRINRARKAFSENSHQMRSEDNVLYDFAELMSDVQNSHARKSLSDKDHYMTYLGNLMSDVQKTSTTLRKSMDDMEKYLTHLSPAEPSPHHFRKSLPDRSDYMGNHASRAEVQQTKSLEDILRPKSPGVLKKPLGQTNSVDSSHRPLGKATSISMDISRNGAGNQTGLSASQNISLSITLKF